MSNKQDNEEHIEASKGEVEGLGRDRKGKEQRPETRDHKPETRGRIR